MSFGFGIGDFIKLSGLAWQVFKALSGAPSVFKNLSLEVNGMRAVLDMLKEDLEAKIVPKNDEHNLLSLGIGCDAVLKDATTVLEKHKSLGSKSKRALDRMEFVMEDIENLRTRIVAHTTLLTAFQTSVLRRTQAEAQSKILDKLEQLIDDIKAGKRKQSLLGTLTVDELEGNDESIWANITTELEDTGIDHDTLLAQKEFILDWFEETVSNAGSAATSGADTPRPRNEAFLLPSIETFSLPSTGLDTPRTESLYNASEDPFNDSSNQLTIKDSPSDFHSLLDQDIAMGIQHTAFLLKSQYEIKAGRVPLPWGWKFDNGRKPDCFIHIGTGAHTSKAPQVKPSSFSAMAALTVPWCKKALLQYQYQLKGFSAGYSTSSDHAILVVNAEAEACLTSALRCLEAKTSLICTFEGTDCDFKNHLFGSQPNPRGPYSDLDDMWFELRLLKTTISDYEFHSLLSPIAELEYAHGRLSKLLEHIQGLIVAFSAIYRWNDFVAGNLLGHLNIVRFWQGRNMTARTKLIEDQLEHWNSANTAIRRCLQWYSNNREMQLLALKTAKNYQLTYDILRGASADTLEIRFPLGGALNVYSQQISGYSLQSLKIGSVKIDLLDSIYKPHKDDFEQLMLSHRFTTNLDRLQMTILSTNSETIDLGVVSVSVVGYRDTIAVTLALPLESLMTNSATLAGRSLMNTTSLSYDIFKKEFVHGDNINQSSTSLLTILWKGRTSVAAKKGLPTSVPEIMFEEKILDARIPKPGGSLRSLVGYIS